MATGPAVRAVLFDFYGTLGESTWDQAWLPGVLDARGLHLDPAVSRRWHSDAWDGREHAEHSLDEATYNTWSRARLRSMLSELGAVEGDLDDLVAEIEHRQRAFTVRPYAEVRSVLGELRARGLRLAVCSNWDWDLDTHLAACGVADLVDARVSSAWVGARKPHRRVFEAALDAVGATADESVFVGDNWVADVEGAAAVGMRPVHVWRHDQHPGDWLPEPPPVLHGSANGVARIPDLRGLLPLVGSG